MSTTDTASQAPTGPVEPVPADEGSGAALPALPTLSSHFEQVKATGYPWLRFPLAMEGDYLGDIAPDRLRTIRISILLSLVLSNGMLLTDWLMVRDAFTTALLLRLCAFTPLGLLFLAILDRLSPARREVGGLLMSVASAYIHLHLSLASDSELAPPYLVCMSLPLLFNSGVAKTAFWMALRLNGLIMVMFIAGLIGMHAPPWPVVIAVGLILLSTSLFTLFGIYWREHEERLNWLMHRHEQVLMEELDSGNRRLDHLSRHDTLTDLANRRHVDEFLDQVWMRARQSDQPVALLMIDVDHFKRYNDHYGHLEGDACLQAIAQALQKQVRGPQDLMSRFGGEEFVAVLPQSGLNAAMAVAERVRAGVENLQRPHADSPAAPHVTISIGVASMRPGNAQALHATPASLIAAADAALYQAKAQGRNRAVGADPAHSPPCTHAHPGTAANGAVDQAHAPADQQEDAQLAQGLPWLRFPDTLEQRFLDERAPARLRYVLISGLLSLFVFDGFLLADHLMAPDMFEMALRLRLLYFTPVALALLCFGWLARKWILRMTPPQLTEAFVVASGVVAASCVAYILASSQHPYSQYYHVGLMVFLTYGNIVQRLRFWYATLFSLIICGLHVAGIVMVPAFNQQLVLPTMSLVGATAVFTLMANYAMERDERWRYLLSRRRLRLMTELADVQQRLRNLSRVDTLTGLANRRHFETHLRQIWQRAQHPGGAGDEGQVALIMIDVDHFKLFNDRYGHPAGDRCLAQVAMAIKACLRSPHDLTARYGGEEFIAVLPRADLAMATRAAHRIRAAVEALGIPHQGSPTAPVVTVSIGVACRVARPGQTETSLVSDADRALYEAKRAGRNAVAGA